ncbi:hypothetical protein [Anaeromyxobacter sp. SG64]|uniref:DUF6982 domain-containing protein n=1 Tax=Anaeromyxobacter sp. SG64 TaxID=2925409 RepID=UPI001F57A87A|nr:hypothetical protein [Anaeromyxobacter sp. SG64]
MPDPRSVMQEYRTLEAKRLAKGLSPDEERRHAQLRDLVGGEPGGGAPRGGFDVNAAAARLRESLLPAGLRNRPPPPPELSPEPEPEPFFPAPAPAAPAEVAFDAPPPEGALAPLLEDGATAEDLADLFDPAVLGWEGDPGAAPQGAGAWDPNAAPVDAAGQPWDPSALPVDAAGQPWDPNALPVDAAGQPWDPNALPVDAAGQPWDPNAAAWDPAAAGGAAGWEPGAYAAPTAAGPWDAGAYPAEPELSALGEADGTFDPAALAGEDAAPAELLGAGSEAAWDPALAPEAPEPTQALDLAAAAPEGDAASELPALELEPLDESAFEVAPAPDDALAGFDPTALDAAAMPEPTQLLGLASEPEPTLTMPLRLDAGELPPAGWDPAPAAEQAPEGAAFGAYDELASGAPAFGDGTDTLAAEGDGVDPALGLDPSAPPPVFAPAAGELGGEYDDSAAFDVAAALGSPDGGGFEADRPLAAGGVGDWHADRALEEGFALASGGSFDAADPAGAWATAEAPAPWETAPPEGAGPGAPAALGDPDASLGLDTDGVTESHPLPAAAAADDLGLPEIVEELPTVDGAEILEEIPADEADTPPPSLDFGALPPAAAPRAPTLAPAAPVLARSVAPAAPPAPPAPARPASAAVPAPVAAASAAPASSSRAAGSHRVVVHMLEGTVKRGVIEDADLAAPVLALASAPGAAADELPTEKMKAIFFMLPPGEAPPPAEGKKVRVTFRDGRQVAGFGPDYREDGPGFFMLPGDTRTNTGRIWVYRAAVKDVVVS